MNYLFLTVQPFGIPLVPVVHAFMDEAFVNVPEELTFCTQFSRQSVAEMSFARHVIDDNLGQS